jgi:hypothetical protein
MRAHIHRTTRLAAAVHLHIFVTFVSVRYHLTNDIQSIFSGSKTVFEFLILARLASPFAVYTLDMPVKTEITANRNHRKKTDGPTATIAV